MSIIPFHQTVCDASIVIPIYNGSHLLQKHVLPLLAYLEQQPFSVQIIISDDGSADFKNIADFANQYGLLVARLDKNMGKGATLRKGFGMATGKVQLFTDVDIPFQYNNINTVVAALQKNPYQLIIGDRKDPASVYFEKSSNIRHAGSYLVSSLVSNLFVKGVYDTQCGLKGMGQTVAQQLFSQTRINRFAIDVELIYLAAKMKIAINKIPVQLRFNDRSSVRVVRDGWQLLQDLYRIKKLHGSIKK